MNKGSVFPGILIGLAVGAILGVLFAPAKGSETRQKISDKGNEFAETLKRKLDGFIDDLINKPTAGNEGSADSPGK
jgi:gas vesicle protein